MCIIFTEILSTDFSKKQRIQMLVLLHILIKERKMKEHRELLCAIQDSLIEGQISIAAEDIAEFVIIMSEAQKMSKEAGFVNRYKEFGKLINDINIHIANYIQGV